MFDIFFYFREIRKTITKQDILLITFCLSLYFLTRLVNLDKFPIFSDEGIYIHWAKVAWHDATWRFISLTDGRQPLQTWATIPFLKLFPDNALLAGRLFSVSTGFLALGGIFSTIFYLFGKRAAFVGALLYIFTPYFLFYDRMALVDSAVNAFTIWIFFLGIILAKNLRLDIALVLGLLSGLALLAKSSVRLDLAMVLFAAVFIIGKTRSKLKLVNFLILYAFVLIIAFAIYNVQRLSPFFHFVAVKNNTFVLTLGEFVKNPFNVFSNNIRMIPFYLFSEMAVVAPLLGLVGMIFLWKKNIRLAAYVLLWILTPYLVISFGARVLFPRYLLFIGGLLLISAAFFISTITDRKKLVIIMALFTISVVYFNYTILFDYKQIPFPEIDRGQYLEGWTAGWGAREIVQFAREKSAEKTVTLIAEGNFGMSGDVLDVFLKRNDKIGIKGYWPLNKESLIENQNLLKDQLVYVIFSHRSDFPSDWPIRLIKKYEKPKDQSAIFFYQLVQ